MTVLYRGTLYVVHCYTLNLSGDRLELEEWQARLIHANKLRLQFILEA
jgi:hypothetical protein